MRRQWFVAAALGLASLAAPPAPAAEPRATASNATSAIDPDADRVLRRMSEFLASAKSLRFHAQIEFDEVTREGEKLEFQGGLDVALARPGRLFMDFAGELGAKRLWIDSATVTIADGPRRVYATESAAESLDATLASLAEVRGMEVPFTELLAANPYHAIASRMRSIELVGSGVVAGVVCDHLAFRGEHLDAQLWVERGSDPVPAKLVLTYKARPMAPQWAAVLSKWEIPAKVDPEEFVAKLPDGFAQIAFRGSSPAVPAARREAE
jgi:hypothetical protein